MFSWTCPYQFFLSDYLLLINLA